MDIKQITKKQQFNKMATVWINIVLLYESYREIHIKIIKIMAVVAL